MNVGSKLRQLVMLLFSNYTTAQETCEISDLKNNVSCMLSKRFIAFNSEIYNHCEYKI